MSALETNNAEPEQTEEVKKRGRKKRVTHRKKAEQYDVSTKTIDRWVDLGILPPPDYINGRKYHDPDAEPRRGRRQKAWRA